MFGHERGAFTGAQFRRKGKFELADGGTIFLDEVGTISPKMQVELLRVIESRQFARVGGNDMITSDFRIICATNRDLEVAVKDGLFREDLYYRLNVFSIFIPPLRERRVDISHLTKHFIEYYSQVMNKAIQEIDPDAMDMLVRYDWPGNIRELENVIERAMVLAKPPSIRVSDLPFQLSPQPLESDNETLDAVEKVHIIKILQKTNWNITRSAEMLDIDRVTLYNKIAKYGLKKS